MYEKEKIFDGVVVNFLSIIDEIYSLDQNIKEF